jgi:hypothetical protein
MRQTVDEDDDMGLEPGGSEDDEISRDEYEQNLDEYDDVVKDTLDHADDQTNLLFKNILKKEGFGTFHSRNSFKGMRGSVNGRKSDKMNMSGGSGTRFSSKYGDNRLYLQRLSRTSLDSSSGLAEEIKQSPQYMLKVKPKLRNYSKDDLDESYFAARSNGGDCNESRESDEEARKCYAETEKREFKILEKKPEKMKSAGNEISSIKYTPANFLSLPIVEQLAKPLNTYLAVMMLLQMIPTVSLTDNQPTLVLTLGPLLFVSILLELRQDTKRRRQDRSENRMTTQKLDHDTHQFEQE